MKQMMILVFTLITLTSCTVTRTATPTTSFVAPELGVVTPTIRPESAEDQATLIFAALATGDTATIQVNDPGGTSAEGTFVEEVARWENAMHGAGGIGAIRSTTLSSEQRGQTTIVHGRFVHERGERTMDLSLTLRNGQWTVVGWRASYAVPGSYRRP